MVELRGKKVLLIASRYRGYYLKIAEAIEKKGAFVTCFVDEPKTFLYYQFIDSHYTENIFLSKFYQKRELESSLRILNKIKGSNFDYILVIKGYVLSESFLTQLREIQYKSKMILYQWDSLRSFNYLTKLKYFDKVFSFDSDDCENYTSINYLPLFFTDDYAKIGSIKNIKYTTDAFFLGVNHSIRIKMLNEIANFFEQNNFSYNFYLFTGIRSKFKSFFKPTRYKRLSISIPFDKFKEEYINSRAIVDITSINQTGLPIRIIEAVGANKKIITTNINIIKEKFYHPSRIFIWGKDNLDNLSYFLNTPILYTDTRSYSIHSFVNNLFS